PADASRASGLYDCSGPHDIRRDRTAYIVDRAQYVRLRGQVKDDIDVLKESTNGARVCNVCFHEAGILPRRIQIGKAAPAQIVYKRDGSIAFVDELLDQMTPNEAGAAGHQNPSEISVRTVCRLQDSPHTFERLYNSLTRTLHALQPICQTR